MFKLVSKFKKTGDPSTKFCKKIRRQSASPITGCAYPALVDCESLTNTFLNAPNRNLNTSKLVRGEPTPFHG